MSSSAPLTEDPTAPKPDKKGFSKYVHRVKTVFKKGDSRRSSSLSSTQTSSAAAPITSTGTASTPPVQKKEQQEQQKQQEQKRNTDAHTTPSTGPQATKVHRATIEQERAKKLAERYGLVLEPQDWITHPIVDRVEKPIRMRIHRTCHKCHKTFGVSKICSSCEHVRCTKCPRYPVKKTKDSQTQAPQNRENDKTTSEAPLTAIHIDVDEEEELTEEQKDAVLKRKYRLTIPSKTGGQALVRKKPMQRVRRYCHQCGTFFNPNTHICSKCQHERCTECPRDPAKKHKYPDGYPGDSEAPATTGTQARPKGTAEREIKQPRRIMRYRCHDCHVEFNTGSDICGQCRHQRCENCIKLGPKVLEHREILAPGRTTSVTTEKNI